MEKKIIELSSNKYRLTYNASRTFFHNESTFGKEDTPITILNPIIPPIIENIKATMGDMDAQSLKTTYTTIGKMITKYNETLLISTTPREILLGRKSLFFKKIGILARTFGVEIPNNLNGTFGFIAVQNGTMTGPYEIYTGYRETVGSLGELVSYQGRQRSNIFKGKCSKIQYSLGELRPSPLKINQTLDFYRPEFGRLLHWRPTGTRRSREGLLISYIFDENDLKSPMNDPERNCYCLNTSVDNYCSLDGVLEVAPVSQFAPILVHFNHVELDPRITDSIANWDDSLTNSNIEAEQEVDKLAQFLVLKSLGLPIQLDFTVVLFMKVTREPMFK